MIELEFCLFKIELDDSLIGPKPPPCKELLPLDEFPPREVMLPLRPVLLLLPTPTKPLDILLVFEADAEVLVMYGLRCRSEDERFKQLNELAVVLCKGDDNLSLELDELCNFALAIIPRSLILSLRDEPDEDGGGGGMLLVGSDGGGGGNCGPSKPMDRDAVRLLCLFSGFIF